MTLQNKRWTRQPYGNIYANQGAKYFENEFMEGAMNRWEEIKQKLFNSIPFNKYILGLNLNGEVHSAETKNCS